ncbi:MAG TPA: energy transducer TonB [Candidatus Acidoferrales bacterium]|nr:energy transducer TonB [Candidatus Acidoferrales bacterium]
MFRAKHLSPARLLVFAILILALASPLLAQTRDPILDELAEQLMYGHSQHPPKKSKSRAKAPYLVTDFQTAPSIRDRLGPELANEFARALYEESPEIATLDRVQLGALLEKECLGPQVLQVDEVALWFAKLEGAQSVVFGMISPHENGFDLTARLVNLHGKELSRATKFIEWSEDRRALAQLPPREPPAVPSSLSTSAVSRPGTAGVPEPKCESCPQPPYTDEARSARLQGNLQLTLMILPDGSVHVMSVHRYLACGLTAQAVDTVRRWKFIPPVGPAGGPVTLDLTVEISFRLL